MARPDGRGPDQLRPVTLTRGWSIHPEGSVLVEFGDTRVLCTASVTEGVPRWRKGSGLGWVTAEYAMLPRATNTRSDRESVKGRVGGRTHEISRLIGRSLRACIDLKALGENSIVLDCDVLQADGGTRTAAITGAYVALHDAVTWLAGRKSLAGKPEKVMHRSVAAVSVGIIDGEPRLDLLLRRGRRRRGGHERGLHRRPATSSRCRAPARRACSPATSSTRCSTWASPAAPSWPTPQRKALGRCMDQRLLLADPRTAKKLVELQRILDARARRAPGRAGRARRRRRSTRRCRRPA